MAVNTTSSLSNTMSIFYDKKFLERLKALLRFGIGATIRNIPANAGKTIYFNRMDIPTLSSYLHSHKCLLKSSLLNLEGHTHTLLER